MESAEESTVYRFAGCELDPREHRLLVHGQPVTLTPKVFETLVLLVERAGHVVSKDELMAALWPRGFVHESNLTKHIWLIRRALGDGEEEGRCVETVPKLGYRFVASVERVTSNGAANVDAVEVHVAPAASSGTALPPPAPSATSLDTGSVAQSRLRAPHAFTIAATLILVVFAGVYLFRRTQHGNGVHAAAPDAGAVAIVDFNNLSGNAKDTWLGPALEQMLATEVAAEGQWHAVPEELVRPARADLPAPDAGGYAPASLTTLQRRLGAHYVLSGAYLVSGNADAPQLRVDLTVQDTQSGKSFATLSHTAAVGDLPRLVALIGGELRGRFGERAAAPAALKQIAAAQPPTAEVARHLGFALQALGQYDGARARDELLQAIAQSPGYAPAYLYLARAWSMLGYRAKALAAAKQAAANMEGLSREQQLQIRAQQALMAGDAAQVAALRHELVKLHPDNPEYCLQWIGALTNSGKFDEAQAALAKARKLPELQGDPRIELAATDIEFSRTDYPAMVQHARAALEQARQRNEAGLIAEAELLLGIGLKQDRQAEPMLRAAAADFRRIGNPHGEAQSWQNLANLQDNRNQHDAARESYQRAMAIYQGIEDLGGEAAIYDNLSNMLWSAGDRDGAVSALRQALAIARETNDPVRQAWTLTGLATMLSDESAGDEVAAMYREAIALDRQTNTRSHLAFTLSYYADLLRVRGQLDEADETCRQAQSAEQDLAPSSRDFTADFECTQIVLDRGGVDTAHKSLEEIETAAIAAKDTFNSANAQLVLGQIAMGRKQWSAARDVLQKSLQGWSAQNIVPGEATAGALLALCDGALDDSAARDQAATRAKDLRRRINTRQESFVLDLSLAELQAVDGNPEQASATLQAMAADAQKRNWIGYAFEARLAELRVLERGGNAATFKSSRDALAADARKAGFGWVGQRVAMLAPGSSH